MNDTMVIDPDSHGDGLIEASLDPSRYDGQSDHPREVAGMLHAMMPSGVRVLDVGVGTGSVALIANRGKNNDVTAIEPNAERAAIARQRGLRVVNGMLDDAFLDDHPPFDVAMASDVIEHTPSPADFLALLRRAVRPGGRVLLSVPNVAHWSVRINLMAGRFDYQPTGIMDATHLRWFTEKTLRALLTQQRLEIVRIAHSAGYALPVYLHPKLRWIPTSVRDAAIGAGTSLAPRLFGAQHVVEARVPG